jgi:FAD/FMN-containing dehydrogenase
MEIALAERVDDGTTLPAGRAQLVCFLEQWRLAHGDAATAPSATARLRRSEAISDHLCADLVEAWAAVIGNRADADERLAALDALLRQPPPVAGAPLATTTLALARLYEDRGNLPAAYRIVSRDRLSEEDDIFVTRMRERARLAARLGNVDAAVRAYRVYLAFVADPEPGPAAEQAELARRELAALIGDP